MQALVRQWESAVDAKAVFLGCYQLMTGNTLRAIAQGEFQDRVWVDHLLHRFADYYFVALEAYERNPAAAPRVWQATFAAAADARLRPIQNLLLGVNAHINYDLVLTLVEVLRPEWSGLSAEQRAARYADHCHVNAIIARTIDTVQDQVLGPAMPEMRLVDALLGRLDEQLVSALVRRWRETVWRNTLRLLAASNGDQERRLLSGVETETLRLGRLIGARGRLARVALPGRREDREARVLRLPRKRI
jgi:hypothetical protein